MATRRVLPFPLLIICLLFIRSCSSLPAASQEIGSNPMRSRRLLAEIPDQDQPKTDDYDLLETTTDPPTTVSPHKPTYPRCNYSPCRENQVPCKVLSASTNCRCPGLTSPTERPLPPNLRSVSWNGSEVVVRWCAPNSYVTHYVVTVGGKERQKIGEDKRSTVMGDIDGITQVCVIAENLIGRSETSCVMYRPQGNSLALIAGLVGGALGFLLLLLLAVLLWRHNRQRKQEASISMHNTADRQ